MTRATSEYLMQPPRSRAQVAHARVIHEAFREFRDFTFRNAMFAVNDVRRAADELPEGSGKEMILAMCADIKSEFRGRLADLDEEARNA